MIVYKDKGFKTHSDYPDSDWVGDGLYIVEDGSDLALKIARLYPYYDFVLSKSGRLIDVIETAKPELPETDLQKMYDDLAIQYIHKKYSYDDENKLLREYLSNPDKPACKQAFEAYNAYVLDCKAQAYTEVYGDKSV